jgi:hypothetical protein
MYNHAQQLLDGVYERLQYLQSLPPSLPNFLRNRDAFLQQTRFQNGYVTLQDAEKVYAFKELLCRPDWFERYIFSSEAMAIVTNLMVAVREDTFTHSSYGPDVQPTLEKLWKDCLGRFNTYGVDEDEVETYLLHYLAHASHTWTIDWQHLPFSFQSLVIREQMIAAEQASPYAQAYQVLRLLEEYNWDLQNPRILDAVAELAFDPMNKTFLEQQLDQRLRYRGADPRRTLTLLWELVRHHLRTGGRKEEKFAWTALAQDDDIRITWIVDGLCAKESLSVLAGAPKAGKTNLIRNLLYSLTTGDPWLDRPVRAVPTVYYCLEDPNPVFIHSMKKLYERPGTKRPLVLAPLAVRFSVNPSRLLHELKHDVQDGAEFIVIDTLFKVLDVADSNDYAEMTMALDVLARFAKQHHVRILVLHHSNKQSGKSGSSLGMLGSTAIPASSECNLMLTRNEDTGERHIYALDNRFPAFLGGATFRGERVNFDKDTGYVWLSPPATKEDKKLVEKVEVYYLIAQLLKANPAGVSKKFLKDNIAKGKDLINTVLTEGLDKGVFLLNPEHKIGGSPAVVLCPLLLNASEEEFEARLKASTAKVG